MSSFGAVLRAVSSGRLREQPGRLIVTVLAVALGVALATAVFLINAGAVNEFGMAARRLVGQADVVLRGPPAGFDEELYVRLAQHEAVGEASPVLELQVALLGQPETLRILAVDPLRAVQVQRDLLSGLRDLLALFGRDAVALSANAARDLGLGPGDVLELRSGTQAVALRVADVLPDGAYPQRLGLMDIATAQWVFGRTGLVNRIDLRLQPGVDVAAFLERIGGELPAGVVAGGPEGEVERASNVTRAYRVNLNMLAMVALLTGAFLVFSTQALSVLRRRVPLALLRAIGATRRQVERALLVEGLLIGSAGALVGVLLGQSIALAALARLGGDLGSGYLRASGLGAGVEPGYLFVFLAIGTIVAAVGAVVPAREAARRAPATALKAGDAEMATRRLRPAWPGLLLAGVGAACAVAPPLAGIPVFGYVSVAVLLLAGVLLVPSTTAVLLARLRRPRNAVLATALAQLRGSAGQSAVSLAAIIVSFSLMVAMAIMVHSFRESFDRWLGEVLPADLHMRVASSTDTAYWSEREQAGIAVIDGVARAEFRRQLSVYLDAGREPVALIARRVTGEGVPDDLPLLRGSTEGASPGGRLVWISEPVSDLYRLGVGDVLDLPLAGALYPLQVAGIWRDYGRSEGAIVVDRDWYAAVTGDRSATQAALWLEPGVPAERVEAEVRRLVPRGDALQVYTGLALKQLSMQYFDRAFAVTYVLEAVAVVIGLVGVSFAFGAQALARRAEFGMLRHIGMLRRQVVRMLAGEGVVLGALGVAYGLLLGFVLSLVLVYVINRQSFNWSIDLEVPWLQLAGVAAVLVAAAGLTAMFSGRAATGVSAVRAVREDW